MNSNDLKKGQRVVDKEDGSRLVVTDIGLGPASQVSYNGKKVSASNKDYPSSDVVVEVVYESNVIKNHQPIDEGFSIKRLGEYEDKYGVHINRYKFPISRLTVGRDESPSL